MDLFVCDGAPGTGAREVIVPDGHFADVLAGRSFLLFDGAMGTALQQRGIDVSFKPQDLLNLSDPALVVDILHGYVEAGCEVVTTNTFRSNADILGADATVEEVYAAAARCAREAGARYVAGEIGPTGHLFEPYGDMSFDHAFELFSRQAHAAADAGCDLLVLETFTDLLEMKAAVLAAKEACRLPIVATMSFGENGRTMMGVTPAAAARTLCGLGASVLGVNCSVGPDLLLPVVSAMAEESSVPVIAQPNAGLPEVVDGVSTYAMTPGEFVAAYEPMLDAGVTVVGSCCGTNPAFSTALARMLEGRSPKAHLAARGRMATSARAVLDVDAQDLASRCVVIELSGSFDAGAASGAYFAAMDANAPAYLLDLTGATDEQARAVVDELQSVCTAPLWFSSEDERAVEAAARVYAGCPVIGVAGAAHSETMQAIAAHYGCVLA